MWFCFLIAADRAGAGADELATDGEKFQQELDAKLSEFSEWLRYVVEKHVTVSTAYI